MGTTTIYVILAICVLGLIAIGVRALMDRRAEQRSHAYRPAPPSGRGGAPARSRSRSSGNSDGDLPD